jgi:hypothetical protein
MICSFCRSEIVDYALFCTNCGHNLTGNEAYTKKRIPLSTIISSGIILFLLLGLVIMIKFNVTAASDQKYFKTPKAAAEYFTKCISNNDYEGAMRAFAIEEMVKNYDFVAYNTRLQSFMPMTTMAPEYPEYFPLNRVFLSNQVSQGIKAFIYSFIYEDDIFKAIILDDIEYSASGTYEVLDPKNLKILELEQINYVYPDLQESERNQENSKEWGKVFGFTERKEYYSLYKFGDKYFFGGFIFVKYKKGWQIEALYTNLGGTPMNTVTPIEKDDYIDMVGNKSLLYK